MHLSNLSPTHYTWVEAMGWHNKDSSLALLALVASEIGELAEAANQQDLPLAAEEMADIALRVMDMLYAMGHDIDALAGAHAPVERRGLSIFDLVAYMSIELSRCVNVARAPEAGPALADALGCFMQEVFGAARACGVDLRAQVERKMQINQVRGARGRLL